MLDSLAMAGLLLPSRCTASSKSGIITIRDKVTIIKIKATEMVTSLCRNDGCSSGSLVSKPIDSWL